MCQKLKMESYDMYVYNRLDSCYKMTIPIITLNSKFSTRS